MPFLFIYLFIECGIIILFSLTLQKRGDLFDGFGVTRHEHGSGGKGTKGGLTGGCLLVRKMKREE